ncbi:CDP-alcohol phosphatidyltransferase family protein [Vibrio caribbeanicus]|uniref:CDP-alcohol phosphatidyltransferase family protein n=1 Tax=Vibrio caribbeanicus TaxID=701175 RepID=UPI0030DA23FD
MLDKFAVKAIRWPLYQSAKLLDKFGVTANQITTVGFLFGVVSAGAVVIGWFYLALILILVNRVFDGLDGALARMQGITDAGGFLDIVLDFIFYSMIPFAFVLYAPSQNGIAGAFLIFSFIGTGSSFLAFAVMAAKRNVPDPVYSQKSLYYLSGLTEGTETIACLVLFCIFPQYFHIIAFIFGTACWLTTCTRIYGGFQSLNNTE